MRNHAGVSIFPPRLNFGMARIEQNDQILDTFGVEHDSPQLENYDKIQIYARNWVTDWSTDDENVNRDRLICSAPLTAPVDFKVTPKYTPFGTVVQGLKIDSLKTLSSIGQFSMMGKERKTYTGNIEGAKLFAGANDISYSFNFRLLEGLNQEGKRPTKEEDEKKNVGWSVYPLFYFNRLCIPKFDEKSRERINTMFNALSEKSLKAFGSALKDAFGLLKDMTLGGLQSAGGLVFDSVSPDADITYPSDQFAVRTQNTIDIRLSNIGWLRNMVLTGYGATFSREVLANGLPVYVDYSISVSPIVQPTRAEVNSRYLENLYSNILGDASNLVTDYDAKERMKTHLPS